MKLFLPAVVVSSVVLSINSVSACTSGQLIDYDYQASELLGNSYASFGRLWSLDGEEVCSTPKKYTACLTVNPKPEGTELQVRMVKNDQEQTTYKQSISYNSNEVVRFSFEGVDVYLKLYVSNTIADMKMAGKNCNAGFPNLPRQITRTELNNMYKG
ncbi:hypothetical protein CXF85_05100 [Colwellia sp. 75C3]|uniref:hypothetical protein n=1 Tax=Colwellia sp. 75C3 TaxID=888425 RepID=UPI000C33B25D|nr:hypothetical protein [Colwellia sp. 75C3]PKG84990.1 hypothetical protein CXF85_05100 [Colwellia sp. 75C3]